ncbi:hypothetical protein DM01DRAFT_1146521 [Hesseltinella vesiculosa]|uniref:Uncharacterized protein n=1 Tax=Hesseltinella vesiculosa TaxID=101127 RepID=A0A1X2G6X7_9FUNG|nr:hypothetical protein DM01DRAFT_1146521 [Hesseltinella vesiculosa]
MPENRKRHFPGFDELDDFVRANKKPRLYKFVTNNINHIPAWSVAHGDLDGHGLFALWKRRLCFRLASHGKFTESKKRFEDNNRYDDRWNAISLATQELAKAEAEYQLYSVKSLKDGANRAYATLSERHAQTSTSTLNYCKHPPSLEPALLDTREKEGAANSARDSASDGLHQVDRGAAAPDTNLESTEVHDLFSSKLVDSDTLSPILRTKDTTLYGTDDLEYALHKMNYKMVREKKKRRLDTAFQLYFYAAHQRMDDADLDLLAKISNLKSENMVMSLQILAAKHMLTKDNSQANDALVKLSLSRVVNLLATNLKDVYKIHFISIRMGIDSRRMQENLPNRPSLSTGSRKYQGPLSMQHAPLF